MIEYTDSAARIEYNLGNTSSVAGVHISNVRLERVIPTEPVVAHPALPDGNYIYNGQFQEGDNRLGFWTVSNKANAKVFVSNKNKIRELTCVVPASCTDNSMVRVYQEGVKINANLPVTVKFRAKSSKAGTIKVRYGSFSKELNLSTNYKDYEFNFASPASNASGLALEFLLDYSNQRRMARVSESASCRTSSL